MPKADKLSPGAVALLQEPQLAHFTTLMTDGDPQTTPVWVDVDADGGHVLINTAAGRVKTDNIERDPRVSVSVVDKGNDWRYALVRGKVVEQRTEGADAHIDALAKKYLGQDSYPFRNPAETRVILVIKPDNVIEQGT
nr:PPOX class F420-dependent oxidoreductase [Chloroflexia bacterium]